MSKRAYEWKDGRMHPMFTVEKVRFTITLEGPLLEFLYDVSGRDPKMVAWQLRDALEHGLSELYCDPESGLEIKVGSERVEELVLKGASSSGVPTRTESTPPAPKPQADDLMERIKRVRKAGPLMPADVGPRQYGDDEFRRDIDAIDASVREAVATLDEVAEFLHAPKLAASTAPEA